MNQLLLAALASLALAACGAPSSDAPDAGRVADAGSQADGGLPAGAGQVPDAGIPDAGSPKPDAGTSSCPSQGGSNPANAGAACAFNSECPADQRCECINFDCLCRPGARGTGCPGVDGCTVGEDCASSVCAEGLDGGFFCSGECATNADCGPALPVCADVAFVGRICIRSSAG
ncbi:MAG: hypothetical protein FJ086_01670 [Deltaproteobacteria bacterium]|nr:hypothetical protein [Deltaproteobacteria bacterium]